MKTSSIKLIPFSYLLNIFPINASPANDTNDRIGQKTKHCEIETEQTPEIIKKKRNNKYYSEIPFQLIHPMNFESIYILKDLYCKKFFSIIWRIYDLVEKLKEDLIFRENHENLDSISQFMCLYNQLSSFIEIIRISINPENRTITIHSKHEFDFDNFLELVVSGIGQSQQLKNLQTSFNSWIKSLRIELVKFIEESEIPNNILKDHINAILREKMPDNAPNPNFNVQNVNVPSSFFSNLLTLESVKKYIFKLRFYMKIISLFANIEKSKIAEEFRETFEKYKREISIASNNQVYPIYDYFHPHSKPIYNIQEYCNFNLEQFKTQSCFFISQFSKFLEFIDYSKRLESVGMKENK